MVEVERAHVFVVDRDLYVRRLMQQFLGEVYEVEFFDDGYSALDRTRRSPPFALIIEILIPQLDGLALCRLLKGGTATKDVPILVCSVLAAGERARQSGADGFLQKPLERNRVLAAMRALTDPQERRGALPPQEQGAP